MNKRTEKMRQENRRSYCRHYAFKNKIIKYTKNEIRNLIKELTNGKTNITC